MKNQRLHIIILYAILVWVSVSCSNTRFLTSDEILYTGRNKVTIQSPEKCQNQKIANRVIQSTTSHDPNNSIGGKRWLPPVGLWVYNYGKPKGNGKLSNWYYKTLAGEPILVSQVNPDLKCRRLESELFNIGFFHSKAWAVIDTNPRNNRKAKISYFIEYDKPFQYQNIAFETPTDAVDSIINNYQEKLTIKTNDVFDFETVKLETKNIASQVVDSGYYYFNSNYLLLDADTNQTPYKINLFIGKKNEIPLQANRKYTIHRVTVKMVNPTDSANHPQTSDTVFYDGVEFISLYDYLKPEVITQCIALRQGDIYSAKKHQQTIRRLNSYGIFKFINIQFSPLDDSLSHLLNLWIELTPMKEISLDLEANVVSKSTGFSGPGFVTTLSHSNLAKGANKLMVKLDGGFEWQWGNKNSTTLGTTSYNLGVTTSLVFPKIISPFHLLDYSRMNLPKTSVNVGFEFMNKIQYYRMSSFNIGYGYQWRKSSKIAHVFYPVFLNSVTLQETTPEFDSILNENPYIRKSFEEQFIAGMKYDFTFDNSSNKRPHGILFMGSIGSAGNLLDLINRNLSNEQSRPYKTFGNVYSQFMKFSADVRYYRNYFDKSFAFRLYAGLGIPYTNSVVLPYVEQYYSGGANSIRAFAARSLGPGSYYAENTDGIIDQTGDIRLEANVEYRFKMSKTLQGALFLETGNIWLLNYDENRPGADFRIDTFTKQLAVGTGFGLRFDFDFFILRTDVGFPLRRAYEINGSNWLKTTGDVFSSYLFNLAIGYPF